MLNIYFGELPEDLKKDYVFNTSVYFDNQYLDSWLETDFANRVIKAIDKGVILSPKAIDTKILGVIPATKIAGGTKTLLLIKNQPNKIFNASTCGDNCAKYLLEIGKMQDVTINLHHIMDFGKRKFEIQVMNNGVVVHDMKEYVETVGQYV